MNKELDHQIDASLDSYPIQPVPLGFTRKVMRALPKRPVPFRLDFVDLAIPLFLAIFLPILGLLSIWLLNLFDPFWLPKLQSQLQWLTLYLSTRPINQLLAVSMILTSALLAGTLALFLVLDRPVPLRKPL